jgi:hypothetical protein
MQMFPGWRPCGAAVLAALLLASDASAQNGVHVGDIKVYDNRSLSLMLEQLSQQLQSVRVVDQQRLVQALGLTQGSQVRETVRALQVGTLPLPSVQTTEALQEGALQVTDRTSDRAAVPAAAPALPTPLSAPASGVNFGQNAQDLLAEQIDLTYRIFNLQMLLERSLTDRLWKGQPRLQAVVGLEISIDPPRDARDHSAVVELTLTTPSSRPTLVALMPEAKRYNASALSTKSNAFGGAAVAQILTIGYSEQRRGQVFYLFQDVDTIALERLSTPGDGDTDALSFGWSFRPVLGRRSVAPGVRQLFAVLSFPVPDLGSTPPQQVAVRARTYWRKYDQSSLTTRSAARLDSGTFNLPSVKVENSTAYEEALSASVERVEWSATDDRNALVVVRGKNFFPGTKVFIGPRSYDGPATGLTLKSDKTLELKMTLQELAFGEGMVSGRYGPAVPLTGAGDTRAGAVGTGLLLNGVEFYLIPGRDRADVVVALGEQSGRPLSGLPGRAVLSVGETVFPSPYWSQRGSCRLDTPDGPPDCLQLRYAVPSQLLARDVMLQVRVPFAGPAWTVTAPVSKDRDVYEARAIGGSPDVLVAISGRGFGQDWTVQLDRRYTVSQAPALTVTENLLTFRAPENAVKAFTHVLVQPPQGSPFVVPLARGTPPSPSPAIKPSPSLQAKVDSAIEVSIAGTSLDQIKAVKFGTDALPFSVNGDGTEMKIVLSRAVTAKAGQVTLRFEKADESYLTTVIQVQP